MAGNNGNTFALLFEKQGHAKEQITSKLAELAGLATAALERLNRADGHLRELKKARADGRTGAEAVADARERLTLASSEHNEVISDWRNVNELLLLLEEVTRAQMRIVAHLDRVASNPKLASLAKTLHEVVG